MDSASPGTAAPPSGGQVIATRRKFLRHAGVGGAATAALLGLTEVAGLPSAFAAARSAPRGRRPANGKTVRHVKTRTNHGAIDNVCGSMSLFCSPGNCGAACPRGSWCFLYGGCSSNGYICMPGSCRTYHKPCCP